MKTTNTAVKNTQTDLPEMMVQNGISYRLAGDVYLPLIAVDDLAALGKDNALYAALAEIVARNGGLWCAEAESYLLANAPRI